MNNIAKTLQIIILFFLCNQVFGQNCYIENKDLLKYDFSNIWVGETYQGTIGEYNQRIEIRFISTLKLNDSTYSVIGKSKVNSNICDFKGKLAIQNVNKLNNKNINCKNPDFSFGLIIGKYILNEDETQSYVGQFSGSFKTMFNETSNGFVVGSGLYSDEGISEFIGEWKDYKENSPKHCSWGVQIPPTKQGNLFKHYDNEFYLFNFKYINKGWKSYVLANLNSFISIPYNFETDKARYQEDFRIFNEEEIQKSRIKETEIWWK